MPFLPDPELAPGGEHYKSFQEMYGKHTTDVSSYPIVLNCITVLMTVGILKIVFPLLFQNRPSLQVRPAKDRFKIGFSPSVQHATNTGLVVQCEECNKWRLIFSKKKIPETRKASVQEALSDVAFTCGMSLGKYQRLLYIELHSEVVTWGVPIINHMLSH